MRQLNYSQVQYLATHCADPLEIMKKLHGYYERPVHQAGERQGPLVGYAGTYEPGKQYVGHVYVNFAMADQWHTILETFARRLLPKMGSLAKDCVFCGAPMGGLKFSQALGSLLGKRSIFAEKKVTKVATPDSREESTLILNRYDVCQDDSVIIVEDVCNNFSTTGKLIDIIQSAGSKVRGVACFLNRSPHVDEEFVWKESIYPVFAVVRKPIPEYKQDNPAVASDVSRGNVIWKPKDEWDKLEAAMN